MGKKIYKLEKFEEEKFKLFAIHSNIDDYKIAFLLNSKCGSKFVKARGYIDFPNQNAFFNHFEWEEKKKGISCDLFSNKFLKLEDDETKVKELFNLPETKEVYLIRDFKKVDYFIKINSGVSKEFFLKEISKIDEVSLFYEISVEKLSGFSLNFN